MELSGMVATLGRTPGALAALLDRAAAEWVERDDGPGTWSAHAIVGHLLNGDATNWMPRIRMILDFGTARAFEAFDREAMLGWDAEAPALRLERFAVVRQESLTELAALHLTPADLDRRGLHGEFGEVTLGQLLATWVAHDLTHLAQVAEVLAGAYREAVGPWRAFLPALDRSVAAE
jgi:hypothetical protein